MSDADVVQLPEPAAHLSARVHTNWKRGYTAYQVEGVGTLTLVPVLRCPQWWSDPHGRVLPCNHVQVYMGTGGPHTRPENRTDVPHIAGSDLVGPATAFTNGDPAPFVTGDAYIYWSRAPQQARDVLTAVATHWGQRSDIDRVKAAYARAQAPQLVPRAAKRADVARRRFEQAGRELVLALANEQHQYRMKETESAEQAATLIGPDSPVWNEYTVYANRHMDSDRLLVGAVVDAAGNVVDDGANSGPWQPVAPVVDAAGPEEAVAEVVRQIEEGEQD